MCAENADKGMGRMLCSGRVGWGGGGKEMGMCGVHELCACILSR